jgi:hypothetical protein
MCKSPLGHISRWNFPPRVVGQVTRPAFRACALPRCRRIVRTDAKPWCRASCRSPATIGRAINRSHPSHIGTATTADQNGEPGHPSVTGNCTCRGCGSGSFPVGRLSKPVPVSAPAINDWDPRRGKVNPSPLTSETSAADTQALRIAPATATAMAPSLRRRSRRVRSRVRPSSLTCDTDTTPPRSLVSSRRRLRARMRKGPESRRPSRRLCGGAFSCMLRLFS